MRFSHLKIENFRAIRSLELTDLGDVVVIAGPNGCGKSCVYDAIRLLKSVYGGYQQNEWQTWFGEFQIKVNQDRESLLAPLQDRARPLCIAAGVVLSDAERDFLRSSAEELVRRRIWGDIAPDLGTWFNPQAASLASRLREHSDEVDERTKTGVAELLRALERSYFEGRLEIHPNAEAVTAPAPVLELVFSLYRPSDVGVIDYHGPHRNYSREQIGNINLNLESTEERLSKHALYNYANKYSNLKAEMAAGYVKNLLMRQAGGQIGGEEELTETLKELFSTFFPGKEYLGPMPSEDGTLTFPVRTEIGQVHDINELSSGEKEVLYGYLRLRNTAPRNSVLLIDEPELHLNPRLIIGLPQFYHRHLGKALGNQLWLVTHSDALLREAINQKGFKIFHMLPPSAVTYEDNQVRLVSVEQELDRLILDLVGDLATYRPGAKIVILEGGGDTEFDERVISRLFPEFASAVTLISSGNKRRVQTLHGLLDHLRKEGGLSGWSFYSITDSDAAFDGETSTKAYHWDRYHIENYLLEPDYILRVLQDLNVATVLSTPEAVAQALRSSAEECLLDLVRHELEQFANHTLVSRIKTAVERGAEPISELVTNVVKTSVEHVRSAADTELSESALVDMERRYRRCFSADLNSDNWRSTFRGRDILRRFIGKHVKVVKYDVFLNLLLARMHEQSFQPSGMKKVLDAIVDN
jgi:predicted ATPase